MRTTLAINEQLLDEAKALSGARSKKEGVEIALDDSYEEGKH
jgi:Bacterial antitoxin of type II TA system, VapB